MIIRPLSDAAAMAVSPAGGERVQMGRAGDIAGLDRELDFASMISEAIAGVGAKLQHAEAVSISGIKGLASTQDVVEAVVSAEQSLQAAIAVRDKIVSAYMEISRMSI